jgi:hypothetical protein
MSLLLNLARESRRGEPLNVGEEMMIAMIMAVMTACAPPRGSGPRQTDATRRRPRYTRVAVDGGDDDDRGSRRMRRG